MISSETGKALEELIRRLTIFIITLLGIILGIMIAGMIIFLVIGIILYRKSKTKEGREKIIYRILAIIFWVISALIASKLVWIYVS
ncbi:hypothetical protein [Butyrivibrio sp.]|uniref:hypothetical protein n=1 Tax=Butyrivibrio sp. TaxID=28121 RepID=UPI0025BAF6F2|nr:hypothetical protein [Butyrivibrio sp.]MBQ9302348.1 hypothetical protein [Butyrivibrio sp.]